MYMNDIDILSNENALFVIITIIIIWIIFAQIKKRAHELTHIFPAYCYFLYSLKRLQK